MSSLSTATADRLRDRRPAAVGPFAWVGNDYVRLDETADPEVFALAVVPLDSADAASTAAGDYEGSIPGGDRILAHVRIHAASGPREYRVDSFASEGQPAWRVVTPWGERGLLVICDDETLEIDVVSTAGRVEAHTDGDVTVLRQGRWVVAVAADGAEWNAESGLRARGSVIAVTVDVEAERAAAGATALRTESGEVELRSRTAWSTYLDSCPIVRLADIADDVRAGLELDDEKFVTRQLWHWRAARINISRTIDDSRVFIAPDRSRWHGTWSSDGPITLSALVMTSERDIAARTMVEYIRNTIDPQGHHSWYVHSDGRGSLGYLGDTGAFSHGMADIVRAVEFIDRHHPEARILDATGVGERTVYDTLAWYLDSSDSRDQDGDGLWETANLWESSWDNKVGPLFSSASVDEWVEAIGSGTPEIMAPFVAEHRRPMVAMAEQFSYLQAVRAMGAMAQRRGDAERVERSRARRELVTSVISERHWNAETSTYRDWDVAGQKQSDADSLDGFYYLSFETDPDRARALVATLTDPARFGIRLPSTLSRDHDVFDAGGYWDGSYWPREMHYLALGLGTWGEHALAYEVLVDALMSREGFEIAEHLNSSDGSPIGFHHGAVVRAQAMSVGLCLGLLELARGEVWWPTDSVEPKES